MPRTTLFAAVLLNLILAGAGTAQESAPNRQELPALSPALQRIFAGAAPRSVAELKEMERSVQLLANKVIAATVSMQIGTAHGSGVIVGNHGYVLTAAHVVGKPGRDVTFRLSDGRIARGITLGVHMPLDAGVAQITDPGEWPYLQIGDSDNVRVGQWCLASGHPGGHDFQRGPVVRLGRILAVDDLLRSDCSLNAGDSGGPLVNAQGNVIAIHSRIGTSLTNNLHTPSLSYRDRWDEMIAGTLWRGPAYLGIRGSSAAPNPRVTVVYEGSPAERARVQVDDYVTRFAGHEVHTFRDLVYMVQSRRPGEEVTMEITRNGKKKSLDIVVGRRPEAAE